MRLHRRTRIILLAAIPLLILTLCLLLRPSPEPSYNGKSLSAWLQQYAQRVPDHPNQTRKQGNFSLSTDLEVSELKQLQLQKDQAEHAIHAIGSNAVPTLLKLIATRDSSAKRLAAKIPSRIVDRLPFGNSLLAFAFSAATSPINAQAGFSILGPDAASGVPGLIRVLRTTDNFFARQAVIDSLGCIGSAAHDALPDLVLALNNRDGAIPQSAMISIRNITFDPQTEKARPECVGILLPSLVNALKDPHADSYIIMGMLQLLGPDARPSVPVILPFLNSNAVSSRYSSNGFMFIFEPRYARSTNDFRLNTAARLALQKIDPSNPALK